LRKLRGIRTPHHKNTAGMETEIMPIPAEVCIPMSMHTGAPAKPVVKAGDAVKVGQLIGEAAGAVSAPVHASVSGTVKSVDGYNEVTGQKSESVTISADGLQTPFAEPTPVNVADIGEFLAAVRNSGLVGLGGAGFPTAVKLTVGDSAKLDYIIINGAECEPYITSDTRTMIEDAELIHDGIALLKRFFNAAVIIGIESNKKEPIERMQKIAADLSGVEVRALPAMYPQGGEKVLIYNITGRAVPEGGLPLDVGVIVLNCTTLAALARYIRTGMPLVSKRVTVDGPAVKQPKNLLVPIGTRIGELLDYCGCDRETVKKALYGGPMMGLAVPNLDVPVLKSTNAIVAFTAAEASLPGETACIRCGVCASNCPMGLMTMEIERSFLLKKPELLDHYKVNLCMECGCCAYNCPARRPLVQSIKLGKIMLREHQAALKAEQEKKSAKEAG